MSSVPDPLELRLVGGPALHGTRWRLVQPFRIGRAAGSELVLPDPGISRHHAIVEASDGDWLVRDCGSQLGTRLNELPIEVPNVAVLREGDVLGIGRWRFRAQAPASGAGVATLADAETRVSVVRTLGNLAEQRLELLLRCAGEVTAADNEQSLADAVVEAALLGSGYARAALLVEGEAGCEVCSLRPVARSAEAVLQVSAPLLDSARRGGIARLDPGDDASGAGESGSRHALCAPIVIDGRAEAFLYLDSQRGSGNHHLDAPSYCHALARLAALALANQRRLASERAHAALTADLERARDVQRRLVPADRGYLAGLDHALHLHPGRVVAGDIVDVFALADGRVVAMLGDVSGAGLGAGLDMVSVQSFLRAQFAHDADPAQAATRLNRHLHRHSGAGRFVTLWLGVFDSDRGLCRFVDAGHGHALRIASNGTVAPLAAGGHIPLGIDADVTFRAETMPLDAGDLLLLYSDGAIEQESPAGIAFGRDGLVEAVRGANTPANVIDRVLDALRRHTEDAPPDDDMTLLALAWTARG